MENKRELTLTRLYGAPRELVFKAWTDKNLLEKWWGPRLFTNPVCEVDAKDGGSLRITMKGPDGVEYPMGGTYKEVVPPEKIVMVTQAFGADGKSVELEGTNTIIFEDFHGMTKMTLHIQMTKVDPSMGMALEGMEQGWSESLYKLADLLDQQTVK
jgi:uncharacterized protein YndB with AHSA1/START domain